MAISISGAPQLGSQHIKIRVIMVRTKKVSLILGKLRSGVGWDFIWLMGTILQDTKYTTVPYFQGIRYAHQQRGVSCGWVFK